MRQHLLDLYFEIPCRDCGARAGEVCQTYRPTKRPSGEGYVENWVHLGRRSPINQAFDRASRRTRHTRI